MKKWKRGGIVLPLVATILLPMLALSAPTAWAVQKATVSVPETVAHQFPNETSPAVETLTKGTEMTVSRSMIKDVNGAYWYKVRLPSGEVGWVVASHLRTGDTKAENRAQGLDEKPPVAAIPLADPVWSWVLRAMLMGGYGTTPQAGFFGGEAELSTVIFRGQRAYARRIFSAGPAVGIYRTAVFVGGSFIYRVFKMAIIEPEARLRLGVDLTASQFAGGLNAGINIPLSTMRARHVSLYLELGTLLGFGSTAGFFHFWGAGGAGVHF